MPNLRIYHDGEINIASTLMLSVKASHHLLHVLRVKIGCALVIFNGDGADYSGTLTSIQQKQALIEITSKQIKQTESPLIIELGQGISRGDRMDYTIQKSVELGVNTIAPLYTERCNVKLTGSRLENRLAHWQGVIIGACEQSGRSIIPELKSAESLNTWLAKKRDGLCLVCDPDSKTSISELPNTAEHVTVLIGSEGGLTLDELKHAKNSGFIGISLGPRILRTETAAVVMLSLLQYRFRGFATPS